MVWRAPSDVGPLPAGLDLAECRRALALLTDPEAWVGLRALFPGSDGALNVIQPAGEVDALLRQTEQWQRRGLNVYLSLNPVAVGTSRPPNKGPLVGNIVSRRWLLIDIDPVRAPGFKLDSATDGEKACTLALALRIRDHLTGLGWPAPILQDSGNGAYLLYRIDLQNTEESRELVKGALARLGDLFSGLDGDIDRKCFDATRIAKLAGTFARKGPGTLERPHRPCRFLDVPASLDVVGEAELVEFVGVQAEEPSTNGTTNGHAGGWHAPTGGKDVESRAIAYLDTVPPAIDGQGGSNVTFWAARALVWGFELDQGTAYRLLASHYNPRCVGPWTEKELRHKVEDAGKPPFGKDRGWLLKESQPRWNAGDFGGPVTGYDIILAYLRSRYQPVFRRSQALYSARLAREVKAGEATLAAGRELLGRLATAVNAPRNGDGEVRSNGLPQFFNTWSRSAWVDLLESLPEEETAAVSQNAQEEFRRLMAAPLVAMIPLGITTRVDGKETTHTERRSLLEWCVRFAKPGCWRSIRSYRCWCRLCELAGGEVVFEVALRHELFGQVGGADRRLIELGSRRFIEQAVRYGLGKQQQARELGNHAVVLDPAFVADLLSGPAEVEPSPAEP